MVYIHRHRNVANDTQTIGTCPRTPGAPASVPLKSNPTMQDERGAEILLRDNRAGEKVYPYEFRLLNVIYQHRRDDRA